MASLVFVLPCGAANAQNSLYLALDTDNDGGTGCSITVQDAGVGPLALGGFETLFRIDVDTGSPPDILLLERLDCQSGAFVPVLSDADPDLTVNPDAGVSGAAGIAFAAFDSAAMQGTISGNTINTTTPAPNTVLGISLVNEGSSTNAVLVDSNAITLSDGCSAGDTTPDNRPVEIYLTGAQAMAPGGTLINPTFSMGSFDPGTCNVP